MGIQNETYLPHLPTGTRDIVPVPDRKRGGAWVKGAWV